MRPKKCRNICSELNSNYFKPAGIPAIELEKVILEPDEVYALLLADLESLYQEDAAAKMNISRQTFGRIIDSAHKKIADAILNGKALKLETNKIEKE